MIKLSNIWTFSQFIFSVFLLLVSDVHILILTGFFLGLVAKEALQQNLQCCEQYQGCEQRDPPLTIAVGGGAGTVTVSDLVVTGVGLGRQTGPLHVCKHYKYTHTKPGYDHCRTRKITLIIKGTNGAMIKVRQILLKTFLSDKKFISIFISWPKKGIRKKTKQNKTNKKEKRKQ